MGIFWVELAGDSEDLALLELRSVVGTLSPSSPPPRRSTAGAHLAEFRADDPLPVAERLTFSHRVLWPVATGPEHELVQAMRSEGRSGLSTAVRGGRSEEIPEDLPATLGRAYVGGGGRIDLRNPVSKYVVFRATGPSGGHAVAREITPTLRPILRQMRPGALPFRKPVTLPSLLAAALVNLSRTPPQGLILDPFCGTGAILIQAGRMGYRLAAADADGRMLKGTLRNLAHQSLAPDLAFQAPVSQLPYSFPKDRPVDGIVTDPPYGRASSTHGARAGDVLQEALRVLPPMMTKGARFAGMAPAPLPLEEFSPEWVEDTPPIPLRVHRSLTRWIFVLRLAR